MQGFAGDLALLSSRPSYNGICFTAACRQYALYKSPLLSAFHGALGQAYYRGIQAQPLRSNCFSMNFLAGLSMKISHFICNVNIKTPELPRAEAPGRFGFLALA